MIDEKTPVYVINLDRAVDRYENMKKNFCYDTLIRFPAIDGRQWTKKIYHWLKTKNSSKKWIPEERQRMVSEKIIDPRTTLGPNQIACALSHAAIWKEQVKNNIPYVIILEDDIQPTKDYTDSLYKLITIPEDTDILMLHGAMQFDKNMGIIDGFGLFGYILSKRAAENALLSQFPVLDPVDIQWWHRSFHRMDARYYDFPVIERMIARRHPVPLVEFSRFSGKSMINEYCKCTYCIIWRKNKVKLKVDPNFTNVPVEE